jgi:hypothetical protein
LPAGIEAAGGREGSRHANLRLHCRRRRVGGRGRREPVVGRPAPQGPVARSGSGEPSHAEFGDAFARACAQRIYAFEEDILEIADQTEDDYRETQKGGMVPNKELVLRSKARIESRQWLMARRDPKQWGGDRQSVDMTAKIMLLSPEERMQKALQLFDLMDKFVERARKPVGGGLLVYDPGDDALPLLEVPRNSGCGQK